MAESLHSPQAFVLRRALMLLASARGRWVSRIAAELGCSPQTVRNAIQAFNADGLAALQPRSRRPHTSHPAFDAAGLERLTALLHQSPRDYGHEASLWTLNRVAETSYAQGLTAHLVSDETIRAALHRLGLSWQRARRWVVSPDPQYTSKKGVGTA